MPTYSTSYRFELPLDGERSGTWGQMMNTFMGTLLEDALSGGSTITIPTNANYTLVTASGASDETRRLVLNVVSSVALSATRDIIIPSARKVYSVLNSTTGAQAIRVVTSGSTISVTVPNGSRRFVFCDGTNTYDMLSDLPTGVSVQGVPVVTTTASQILTNKTLTSPTITSPTLTVRDNVFTVQDELDNTKQAQFQLSGVTTATTRVLTVPDVSGTIALADTAQTLTNKTLNNTNILTLRDDRLTIQDNADATKQLTFELSGITTGTTRTLTAPDASGTIATIDATQTLSNKTISSSTISTSTTVPSANAVNVREVGTRGVPLTTQDANYTLALTDAGCSVRHTSGTHTYTIPANASVAFPIGTAITIINEPGAGAITLNITSDTLNRGDGVTGTGTRTISAHSMATIVKTTATTWMITGAFT